MRVIAGTARGVRLESPKDSKVRPTLDRVRESLFSILGESVLDVAFLDLFTGTGAIGIEALSRGAAQAVFVDSAADNVALVQRNLEKTRLAAHARTVRCALPDRLGAVGGTFEIIYADPPRGFTDYQTLAVAVQKHGLLAESGRFILESAAKRPLEDRLGSYTAVDSRTYGETRLTIFT